MVGIGSLSTGRRTTARTSSILGAIPSARTVAFQWERLRMTYWEAASWIIGIVLFDHYVCGWIQRTLNTALPATVLVGYPETHGWLHIVDVVFGLALVAYSEEIVFRRCARHLFQIYLNDGYALVVVTSLLFGVPITGGQALGIWSKPY